MTNVYKVNGRNLHHLGWLKHIDNGINHPSTGAGFLPSTVSRTSTIYDSIPRYQGLSTNLALWGALICHEKVNLAWRKTWYDKVQAGVIYLSWVACNTEAVAPLPDYIGCLMLFVGIVNTCKYSEVAKFHFGHGGMLKIPTGMKDILQHADGDYGS